MKHSPKNLIDSLGCLARTGWLAKQPDDFKARMALAGHWVKLSRRQPLYCTGDPATAVFGLESGLLDIAIQINEEAEVLVHRARPGFWIGEAAVLAEATRHVSVWSAAESRLLCVHGAAIRRNLAIHPDDMTCFFKLSISNAMLSVSVLAEVISLAPQARFARLLLRLAGSDGTVHATQEELGRMAGMSRAAFRRSCSPLISAGAVEMQYGGLRVIDYAALRRSAELA